KKRQKKTGATERETEPERKRAAKNKCKKPRYRLTGVSKRQDENIRMVEEGERVQQPGVRGSDGGKRENAFTPEDGPTRGSRESSGTDQGGTDKRSEKELRFVALGVRRLNGQAENREGDPRPETETENTGLLTAGTTKGASVGKEAAGRARRRRNEQKEGDR